MECLDLVGLVAFAIDFLVFLHKKELILKLRLF